MTPPSRSTVAARPRKWSASGSSTSTRSEAGWQERADGPEEEPEQDEHADRAHAPDHPTLLAEAPSRVEDRAQEHEHEETPEQCLGELDIRIAGEVAALRVRIQAADGEAPVRKELRVGQLGLNDEPGRRAEARIAGREREEIRKGIPDNARVAW